MSTIYSSTAGTTLLHMLTSISYKASCGRGSGESRPAPQNFGGGGYYQKSEKTKEKHPLHPQGIKMG